VAHSGVTHLVINRAARKGSTASVVDEIIATFGFLGAMLHEHRPGNAEATTAVLRELVADGPNRIVVVGGDGAVHLAANALAGSKSTLGIVAAGTGNDSATGLGLPSRVRAACRAALADPVAIDLIQCGNEFALSVATFGFGANVNDRAERMRWPKGTLKYTAATLRELPGLRSTPMSITVDGEAHAVEPNLVAIANTPSFGGGMKVAPDASPTDGLLDVIVMGPASRFTFATVLPQVFTGHHVRHPAVTQLRGREVTITGAELPVRADGEPFGLLPATFTAAPGMLNVAGAVGRKL